MHIIHFKAVSAGARMARHRQYKMYESQKHNNIGIYVSDNKSCFHLIIHQPRLDGFKQKHQSIIIRSIANSSC